MNKKHTVNLLIPPSRKKRSGQDGEGGSGRKIGLNFKFTIIPSQRWFVREGREGISIKKMTDFIEEIPDRSPLRFVCQE